jgi:hypothetical protein
MGRRLMYFVASDGVRRIKPSDIEVSPYEIETSPITSTISDVWARVNLEHISKAYAIYRKTKYILAVPLDGATEPNAIIVWDERLKGGEGGWLGVWEGWNAVSFVEADIGDGSKLYISTSSGTLGESYDYIDPKNASDVNYQDFGEEIISGVDSRGIDFDEPANQKRWLDGEVVYRLRNISLAAELSATLNGDAYDYPLKAMEQKKGLTLPLSLPFDLPRAGNQWNVFTLSGVDEGPYIGLRIRTQGGKLELNSLWVSGLLKGPRKDTLSMQ